MSHPQSQEEQRPRLLIVDDVSANRDILARRFGLQGFETVQAENGQQALSLIEAQAFDTVLLDVQMPGLDGFQVLRQVRSQFSSAELPIIMVTALTQSEDVVKALTLGANDYVTKPVDFAVALARVRSQVERKKAEDTLAQLVAELEVAVIGHFRQLKTDAAALAETSLQPAQSAILESLKSSGSSFVRAVSKALDRSAGSAAQRRSAA